MAKYVTTQQYEPLRTPSNWSAEERRLLQQLTDRFDDLYSKFNRLRFEDLGQKLQGTISGKVDNGTFQTSMEQTAREIALKANEITTDPTTGEETTLSSIIIAQAGSITLLSTSVATAQGAAEAALDAADNAQTDAANAKSALEDITSDNKLTPLEKQETKLKWDAISGEKTKNDASADTFEVSKTAYGNAYAALNTYLNGTGTGLLNDLATTSSINGTAFRSKFSDYYNARTDLLNAITAKAKQLADSAKTAADNAKTAAENAQTDATAAKNTLADIASDSKLTPVEKQSAKQEWDIIVSEKTKIDAQADVYAISKTAYGTAYIALSTYIMPLLSDLTVTCDIAGTAFRSAFKAYYDARQDILNAISSAAKALVDNMKIGGTNLLLRSKSMETPAWGWSDHSRIYRSEDDWLTVDTATAAVDVDVFQTGIKILPSKQYIVSLDIKGGSSSMNIIVGTQNSGGAYTYIGNADTTPSASQQRFVFSVTTPANAITLSIWFRTHPVNYVHFCHAMLSEGNKDPGWNPSPLDPASGVKSSSVMVNDEGVYVDTTGIFSAECESFNAATDLFTIQNAAKTRTLLELMASYFRVGADIAVFTRIIGDVPNTFAGGTIPWAGSFQASLNNIGKWLLAESTLTISGNISEDVIIPVFIGSRLNIRLASGTRFTGHITFNNCANVNMYADAQNTTNIIGTGADYVVALDSSHVTMANLHISGKARTSASDGTYAGIRCDNASTLTVTGVTIDRCRDFGIAANANCKVDVYSCKGGLAGGDYNTLANLGWGVYVMRNSDVSLYDTCPFGASGGAATWLGEVRGTAANTPTDGTVLAAPSVRSYAVSAGYTVKTTTDGTSSVSWGSGEPRQGSWNEIISTTGVSGGGTLTEFQTYNGFGALILTGASNIVSDRPVGKTITAATLKIRRDAEAGTSGAIICTLYQHGYSTTPNGIPNNVLFAQAADAVSIGPNQEMVITMNASAVANLNSGTCKGFGFKNTGGYGRYDIYGELMVTYS